MQYYFAVNKVIWAPSSEFVSSSIPSWQISTAHAQPFRGAMDLAFCLKVPLDSLLVWASSEGSGETVRMRRLAWTFAARNRDKYQIRLTRSICLLNLLWSCRWVSSFMKFGKLRLNILYSIKMYIPFFFFFLNQSFRFHTPNYWLLCFYQKWRKKEDLLESKQFFIQVTKMMIKLVCASLKKHKV